ncbi:MAG: hypothetical protein E6R04_11640 [Spirochaetes bacterium]|nr:MAG: hypothetical protein E6R04_11640 [Spirochaetota bacterium]
MNINPTEYEKVECTKQTLRGVFWNKFLRFIEKNSIGYLAKKTVELLLGGLIGAMLVKPDIVINFISEVVKTHDFAVPKIAAGILIIFSRKLFYRIPGKIRKFRKKLINQTGEANKLIDGVPVPELADYLVRNKNFRREGVNGARETFGLNMKKFNVLAGKLEKAGILLRGENNMRILAPRWSRQALIDFLAQEKIDSGWFRVFKIGDPTVKIRLDRQEINSNIS